jgi:exoribonuclease II
MEYRTSDDEFEFDCEDAEEEQEVMQAFVEQVNQRSAEDMVDTLLIMANICEARALRMAMGAGVGEWYGRLGSLIRSVLDNATSTDNNTFALTQPNVKYDNPVLYFPEATTLH